MSELTVDVVIDTKELEKLAAGLDTSVERVLTTAAFEIERLAKQLCVVDTGALRASIYTNTRGGGSAKFTGAIKRLGKIGSSTKRTRRGTAKSSVMDREISELPAADGDVVAVIGSGMNYAAYVEYGTSRMGAQPYLGPAAEHIARKLNKGEFLKDIFKG